MKTLSLKFAGKCDSCGKRLSRGTTAVWIERGVIRCQSCDGNRPSNEDYPCSDMGYEDACAAAVGYNSRY